MSYSPGSLVQARGREWVVLPESTEDWLVLRPLGGTDREVAGLYLPLEGADVHPATFDLPDPTRPGDFNSCRLLRDAVRLGFRSSAGPFRSFARLNVEPRPYQLVPLLMALKLDPVRLLIADDVGIGKTVEAALIARELLDRGEVQRMAVLCPPHLAEQWQAELREKFHIEAELVLSSTVSRLERNTGMGQSLFDLYPFVIVSTEYIKSSRRRDEFVRSCPELVLVDEAHTCAYSAEQRGGRHLRHQLLVELARNPQRHLILVTATPHSGDEGAFRSLLELLRPDFRDLSADLSGSHNERQRRAVAAHLVQRRRADIREYLQTNTPFPEREEAEETYTLGNDYKKLFQSVLAYARERVLDKSGSVQHQRVRWWSALALLRSLASSPAAAAATLRTRSVTAELEEEAEIDAAGERAVLDLDDVEAAEFPDLAPGAQEEDEQTTPTSARDRLLRFARQAETLQSPEADAKLRRAIELVKRFLKDGYSPILFCRFIPTAEYVAQALRAALPKEVEVSAVTGLLPPAEREERVQQLAEHAQRVLVATDCLSEGINLQEHFDAVMHYDLSWNPTRHEQREGRVDRYGQPRSRVRTLTYYSTDTQIDGLVLGVLLRKHRAIRNSLGISVPVPANTSEVVKALMEGLILRGEGTKVTDRVVQPTLFDPAASIFGDLDMRWQQEAEREHRSRTLFAQHSINVQEVARDWEAMCAAIGSHVEVRRFIEQAVIAHGGSAQGKPHTLSVHLPGNVALREAVGQGTEFDVCFEWPSPAGALYLTRSHPVVEGLATYVLDTALDPLLGGVARRCGAIRTRAVQTRTTLLLLRYRYHILTQHGSTPPTELLAEDCQVLGFRGSPAAPEWLAADEAEALLAASPAANITSQQATEFIRRVVDGLGTLHEPLDAAARDRGQALLEAHRRVRTAANWRGVRYDVVPHLPPDVLGIYVLLPMVG